MVHLVQIWGLCFYLILKYIQHLLTYSYFYSLKELYIIGSRFSNFKQKESPMFRHLGNYLLNFLHKNIHNFKFEKNCVYLIV